ncbi:MAG TPA: SurA N-terminal domain-containing protein [Pyrinomonadaceae bacterium]
MHRFAKQFATLAVTALVALSAACKNSTSGSGTPDSAVAATVNGQNIMLSEVDRVISQQTNNQQDKMMPLELATARLQVLDGLIQQEVLFQRADKDKLLPNDDEITQAINTQKQQANLTEEEYQKMLKESGQTEQQLRETARKQLAIQKLVEKTVSGVTVKDSEVESFFNSNKERFVSPRGVAISAIFTDPRDSAGRYQDDAKSELDAKAKIDGIYQQLRTGADFADVARRRSEDDTLVRGGDMGFWDEARLKQAGIPQEIVSALFGPMQPGQSTPPTLLGDGRYVILKLTDRRLQAEPRTLESPGVRDDIKKALVDERKRILGEALRVVAVNEAKVENFLAQSMIKDPSTLGGLQPATPTGGGASAPAATATPAASATASPAAAATAAPAVAASPSPATK